MWMNKKYFVIKIIVILYCYVIMKKKLLNSYNVCESWLWLIGYMGNYIIYFYKDWVVYIIYLVYIKNLNKYN